VGGGDYEGLRELWNVAQRVEKRQGGKRVNLSRGKKGNNHESIGLYSCGK